VALGLSAGIEVFGSSTVMSIIDLSSIELNFVEARICDIEISSSNPLATTSVLWTGWLIRTCRPDALVGVPTIGDRKASEVVDGLVATSGESALMDDTRISTLFFCRTFDGICNVGILVRGCGRLELGGCPYRIRSPLL
jgi:hypothetical protein